MRGSFPGRTGPSAPERWNCAGAHAGGGRIPRVGGGSDLPVGTGDREGVDRVARTIADLAAERRAWLPHVAEALQYYGMKGWGYRHQL